VRCGHIAVSSLFVVGLSATANNFHLAGHEKIDKHKETEKKIIAVKKHACPVNKKIPTLTKQLQHNEEAKAL